MFGDDANQTNTTTADAAVNPALPPADAVNPLASTMPALDTSSFPAPPVADDPAAAPVISDDATTDTTSSDIPAIPETDPTLGQDLAAVAPDPIADDTTTSDVPTLDDASDTPEISDMPSDEAPAVPESVIEPTADPVDDLEPTAEPADEPSSEQDNTDDTDNASAPAASADLPEGTGELVDIKQQALEQLSPLVDKLEQTPEERFRTTMMMIQASDNQTLVKQAFDAAQSITDDKARAQALLDVINEINYFTTQPKS